jgi:hypothetical protein
MNFGFCNLFHLFLRVLCARHPVPSVVQTLYFLPFIFFYSPFLVSKPSTVKLYSVKILPLIFYFISSHYENFKRHSGTISLSH